MSSVVRHMLVNRMTGEVIFLPDKYSLVQEADDPSGEFWIVVGDLRYSSRDYSFQTAEFKETLVNNTTVWVKA